MTRTWWRNEAILDRFREWLTRTGDDIESLNGREQDYDDAPPRESALAEDSLADAPSEPLPEVGLLSLLEAFTALRHELKLQTKSTRGLEEAVQSAVQSAVTSLDAAIRQFQSVQAREQDAANLAVKPLVESLIGGHEALLRGLQAFEATHRQMTLAAPRQLRESLDEQFRRLPWWRRRLARSWHTHVREASVAALTRASEEDFAQLREGFGLILTRLERSLREHQIRRIECVGRRVDPAEMSVVELVDETDAPPETVIEELRPGYLWHGHVVRFAEVRAVRNRTSPDPVRQALLKTED